ncbi:hypothetical protein [Streptomyces flavofungini]|uniref:Lipoprotein n=1 Tax=Streptomyces flavofungini TaxID=68200 RepID=A0ABS0WZ62_9ACTN|nr:hypothetical protein [Streptomyces flavofungini]MBJ3806101.1 hypothetical protein [Streptomyces flavofungini]GHC47371.1 hypothetical protein GCM10010349_10680 [Streptomyces flavofungini]
MKVTWGVRGSRRVAVAVAVVALAALAGCGSTTGGSGGGAARGSGVPEVDDEKDLTGLPLERYEFSARDHERREDASARFTQRCMRSHGFPDFPLRWRDQGIDMSSSRTAVAISTTLYGSLDLGGARSRGYGLDREALKAFEKKRAPKGRLITPDENTMLFGIGMPPGDDSAAGRASGAGGRKAPEDGGHEVPKAGCVQVGARRVVADVKDETRMTAYVVGRRAAIDKAVAKDPRMRRALDTWADCVVDKGFKRYASPEAAFRDKAWHRGSDGDTRRTRRERDTAVADIECKREHNTAGVWRTVAAERQRRDISRHRSAYEAVRADQERVRSTVRSVLGAGG